jgi:hypothetical protein
MNPAKKITTITKTQRSVGGCLAPLREGFMNSQYSCFVGTQVFGEFTRRIWGSATVRHIATNSDIRDIVPRA